MEASDRAGRARRHSSPRASWTHPPLASLVIVIAIAGACPDPTKLPDEKTGELERGMERLDSWREKTERKV